MNTFLPLSVLAAVFVSGCGLTGLANPNYISEILQATSAQHISCPAKEIAVKGPEGRGVWNWTATCKSTSYSCTGVPDGRGGVKNSSCNLPK